MSTKIDKYPGDIAKKAHGNIRGKKVYQWFNDIERNSLIT
jgi:hypothetical protein